MLPRKCCLALLYVLYCSRVKAEFLLTEDRAYEVINFTIPQNIWKQALQRTPLLKSPIEIVVPVQVSNEDDVNDLDEDFDDEAALEPSSESPANDVIETTLSPVASSTVQLVVQDVPEVTQVANVSESTVNPVSEDEIVSEGPEEQVPGQVFRYPCTCGGGQCGCCTGTILERVSMKACGNMTFIPEDFVFDVRMTVNNQTVVRRRVSASDPPPICFNPRRAPFVRICAEISNIRIRNRNAFACLDINAEIAGFQVYSASFRCFGLGASGVQTNLKPKKPISSGPKPVSLFGTTEDNREALVQNVAGAVLGGDLSNILGIGGGDGGGGGGGGAASGSNDDDDDGPLDAIGDVVGDLFGERRLN